MTEYQWINDPRDNPERFPKEGIGFHWNALCIQGEPKLMKRTSLSPDDFAWQFDLFIKSIRDPDQGVRYPTQGIILIKQHNTDDGAVELTVQGRSHDLSLKQLKLAYDFVVGVLDGKIECDVPISELMVIRERKINPPKETTSKDKKGSKSNSGDVEPVYSKPATEHRIYLDFDIPD